MKKMFRIGISAVLAMALLLGMIVTLPPQPVHAMSGSGTSEDPYL